MSVSVSTSWVGQIQVTRLPTEVGTSFPTIIGKNSSYPTLKLQFTRPDCNTFSSYATSANCRLKHKLSDFLNIKMADNPTLTYNLADFPDKSRLKLPDYCRETFKLPHSKPNLFQTVKNEARSSLFHTTLLKI